MEFVMKEKIPSQIGKKQSCQPKDSGSILQWDSESVNNNLNSFQKKKEKQLTGKVTSQKQKSDDRFRQKDIHEYYQQQYEHIQDRESFKNQQQKYSQYQSDIHVRPSPIRPHDSAGLIIHQQPLASTSSTMKSKRNAQQGSQIVFGQYDYWKSEQQVPKKEMSGDYLYKKYDYQMKKYQK